MKSGFGQRQIGCINGRECVLLRRMSCGGSNVMASFMVFGQRGEQVADASHTHFSLVSE